MSAESRVEEARRALANARRALKLAEEVIDVLEADVKGLRAAYQKPRGRIEFTCQNAVCGKKFTVRASDIRHGNKSGRFCCFACAVAARAVGRPEEAP